MSFAAGALGERLRLLLGVAKRQPGDLSDAVDENRVVSVEILERAADGFVMCRAVGAGRRERWVRPADPAREVHGGAPVVDANGVDRHVLDGEVAGLAVEEQRARGIERAQ